MEAKTPSSPGQPRQSLPCTGPVKRFQAVGGVLRSPSRGAGAVVPREGPPADCMPLVDISGEPELRAGCVGGVRHHLPLLCGKMWLPGLGHYRLRSL